MRCFQLLLSILTCAATVWFKHRSGFPYDIPGYPWMIAWGGIAFDATIVPLLLHPWTKYRQGWYSFVFTNVHPAPRRFTWCALTCALCHLKHNDPNVCTCEGMCRSVLVLATSSNT